MKKNKKGIVFWLTGFSGAGKSEISKYLHPLIEKKFGRTIKISGDNLRLLYNLKGYSKKQREKIGFFYHDFCKAVVNHNFNILIDVVCLFNSIRKANRKYLRNYIEIYIKSDLEQLIKRKKKFFYKKKIKNVWGKDLVPELPKYPDIIEKNNFTKTPNQIAKKIFSKLKK